MMRKSFLGLASLVGLLAVAPLTRADDKTTPQYVPAETTVALIPIINQGGEKNEGFKTKQTENGNKELQKEFAEHGFKIADDAAVAKAVADLKLDLTDEEQQKKGNLYKIGKAVNANLVVLAVITDTSQQLSRKRGKSHYQRRHARGQVRRRIFRWSG